MGQVVNDLRGIVGGRTAKLLAAELDITTLDDLLHHFPRRYYQRGKLTDLATLRPDDNVTILAQVLSATTNRLPSRKRGKSLVKTDVIVTDGTGQLTITFFNQQWRQQQLTPGVQGLFAGTVSLFRGKKQLVHPEYQLLVDGHAEPDTYAEQILPTYPATNKVRSWTIEQAIELVLAHSTGPDMLPEDIRAAHHLMDRDAAFHAIHRPQSMAEVTEARRRFTFEEAFLLQMVLLRRRARLRAQPATPRQAQHDGLVAHLDQQLPFTLTDSQQQASDQIDTDLQRQRPMLRLLQGDVGSGKTVVAVRAMLQVVDAGGQAALVAPTEVLAAQHYATITELLGPLAKAGQLFGSDKGTEVVLLTGSMGAKERRSALLSLASGQAGIVVGTHALFSKDVSFADLGLVVVDEQHRFGVDQRSALSTVGTHVPHTLVMTATPIPRTVAMTVFGDLDVTTLQGKPGNRQPVTTHVVAAASHPHYVDRVWQRIREEVATGRQVFIVCPQIQATEDGQTHADPRPRHYPPTAVTDLVPYLENGPLAGLRLGLLHGQMSSDDKAQVMEAFAEERTIDVLVSTTVIEVGMDIPNASMMVIIDAHRFGVSSLHQLRGRIGRGEYAGLCLLLTDRESGQPDTERLDKIAATNDGFEVSLVDLQTRKEGDVLGTSQSGATTSLRLLSVLTDQQVITSAREEARRILEQDRDLRSFPELAAAIDALEQQADTVYVERA